MKKLYWRPSKVSWQIHVVIAIIALAAILAVETFKVQIRQPNYNQKIKAASIMKESMEVLKDFRIKNIGPIDLEIDPANSGMIGVLISPITSNAGYLESKQTSVNPNWAAVLVDMLKKAGVKEGDYVAAGFSGSFPAMNLAVMAAATAMDLNLIVITSVASSTWGANIPELTWLDMERILNDRRLIKTRSIAASLGGQDDRALGMSKLGKTMLTEAMERNKVKFIQIKNEAESIEARLEIYRQHSEGKPIMAYVNVGGGTISVGSQLGKKAFRPGLNKTAPTKAFGIEGILSKFAEEGVPVIHMTMIKDLAIRHGLPVEPTAMPKVGEGTIFSRLEYDFKLVYAALIILFIALYLFIKLDIGYRIFAPTGKKSEAKPPEPMV